MATTGNLPRIEIYQVARTTTYPGRRPILVPTLIGPCFQIVDIWDPETGALNDSAKAGNYDPSTTNTYAYPGLDNDAEVATGTVEVYFRFGSTDTTLSKVETGVTVTSSGVTLDPGITTAPAQVYIQYRALKKGVLTPSDSPTGGSCGILLEDEDDVTTYLGTIDPRNPLGFAAWISLSVGRVPVRCIGVDEVTYSQDDEDYNGTVTSYSKSLEGAETCDDPYVLVPLTHNESVLSLFKTHVDNMSVATVGKERICFICPKRIDTYPDMTILSGIGSTNGSDDTKFDIDGDPSDIDIDYDVLIIANEEGEYDIVATGTYEGGGGWIQVSTSLPSVSNRAYAVVRKGKPCTTKSEIAEAISEAASSYADKRVRYVYPPYAQLSVYGVDTIVPGYYACAALATMRCVLTPSKPLTNYQIPLLTSVKGSNEYLSTTNLDTMVGAGVWVLVNEGGNVHTLRAVTTDTSTLQNMEDNIVTQVDYVSKMLRTALKPFIGGNLITKEFIKYTIKPIVFGVITTCRQIQAIADIQIRYIRQSETNPDTIEIVADITPLYSLNVIRVTLYI